MSQHPTVRAQKYFPSRAPADIVQWVDNAGAAVAWIDHTGSFHYLGDGTGATPYTLQPAVTKIQPGCSYGPNTNGPNCLIMFDRSGNVVGFIRGDGVPGGTLANLVSYGPMGWIDPSGSPSGSGPII